MKNYELSFLVDAEEDAHEAVRILNGRGASIVFEGPLKKLELAYPIKKRNSAVFGFFHFQCEPEHLAEIKNDLRLNAKIIRHLIITPPLAPRTASFSRRGPRPEAEVKADEKQETPRRQEIVSNAELEEKLEEILK